eukprot:349912-Chlamydomonas_euryale.AAC.7
MLETGTGACSVHVCTIEKELGNGEQTNEGVRVRVTGSRPDWVCLYETKQAIEDDQGARVRVRVTGSGHTGYACVELRGSRRQRG